MKLTESEELDKITKNIIGAAIYVHNHLGPGLLESAYEACLAHQISKRGLHVERQKQLPVLFEGHRVDCGYRIDLLVERKVIVEIKATEAVCSVHKAQLLSYLRLSGCKVGLLINFNVNLLRQGITRIVNHFPENNFSRRSRR
jgi:GxxExxY protein